ncbi:hypothetical protein IEQ34_005419 [Dendrobium chrysotoxum]|uniref:Uncharacterized protein n=1 Tax=Dendrobium chrysotoxum TaxID=161865 RepID=A0AAV7H833_DENCH|nr:hypothetical protein IEQ34_005419 [Dendrobium chrysotoxum]
MDLKALMDCSDGRWTEERHSLFLNCLEASFVRRMLGLTPAGGGAAVPSGCIETNGGLRLDRYVPDSATESTEDSRRFSRTTAAPPPPAVDSESRCASILTGENTRKRALALLDASQDQVVPEFENSEDGENGSASVKRKRGGGV